MKIKMNTLYAGPAGVMNPGGIFDVDDTLAKSLIAGRYASAVEEPAAPVAPEPAPEPKEEIVETSQLTVEALEKAVKPRRRKS